MNPDKITILNLFCYRFGENAVGLGVCFPRCFIEGDLAWMIVEEWPQNRVYRIKLAEVGDRRYERCLLEKPL